jgi:hypothetical protein
MRTLLAAAAIRAGRGLTWRHWAWASAIAVCLSASMPLQNFFTNRYWAFWRVVYFTPWFVFIACLFLVAVAVADATSRNSLRIAAWRYVLSMAVATVVACAAAGAFPEWVRAAPREVVAGETLARVDFADSDAVRKSPRVYAIATLNGAIIQAWLAAFIFVRLRGARRATQALADAELERIEAQGRLIGARLVAAHAEVDPTFVLRTLEEVELAYEEDSARADAMLDEFIALLREAIPRMRVDEPTKAVA